VATLNELLADACSDGFASETSQIRLLQLIAQLLNTDDMTIDEITEAACANGIADVTSPQKLLVIIAQLLQSGGGGGGSGSIGGVVNPDGVVVGEQYQLYWNSVLDTFWVNVDGATDWSQLI
jgi:hypothetical protein